ncbi:DUF6660 family protein [Chryseobacterium edaphi]
MKFLVFIFTFYLMAISLVPCSDVDENSGFSETKVERLQDNHQSGHSDVCSPFCTCNCCQMTVASFKIEPLLDFPAHIQIYFSKKILFQKNDFAYQVYDHIWQPPKI